MKQRSKESVNIYEPLADYFPEEDSLEESNLEEVAKNAYRKGVKDLHPDLGGDKNQFNDLINVWNLVSEDLPETEDYKIIRYQEDLIEIETRDDKRYESDGGEKVKEREDKESEKDDRDPMEREIERELEKLNETLDTSYELDEHSFPGDQDGYSLTKIEDNSSPLKFAIEADSGNGTFNYETTYFADGVGELFQPSYERSFDIDEIVIEAENRFQDQFFRDIARELVVNAEDFKSNIGIK